MLKILIIDDDRKVIEVLTKDIESALQNIQLETCDDFQDAEQKIDDFEPDIIVLDLYLGDPGQDAPGLDVHEFIWERHFCPIVVLSAEPSVFVKKNDPHPFVKSVEKGVDTSEAIRALKDFLPHVEALKETAKYIRGELSGSMRDVAPQVFDSFADSIEQIDAVRRAARRRLAARVDEISSGDRLAPWEMYLCPPVSKNLQLGDILKKVGGGTACPGSFAVVLTPSCDLVTEGGRTPKVCDVLVAQCISTSDGLRRTGLGGVGGSRLENRVKRQLLTPGHLNGIVPFPKYLEVIPAMVADLRRLRLIPIENIKEGGDYERVASIDSPFRELIAWSYMQTAARPGLPDRDFKSWSEEIVAAVEEDDRRSGEDTPKTES